MHRYGKLVIGKLVIAVQQSGKHPTSSLVLSTSTSNFKSLCRIYFFQNNDSTVFTWIS